tara:strand:+ start:16249 stop:16365 length:117 start_codon:yes stop_codon:yes gene_type:complete
MKEQLFEPKRLKELSSKIREKKKEKKTFLRKLLTKLGL